MLFEIYGAGFGNKGAQLMLYTTVERLRLYDSSIEFAIVPKPGEKYQDYADLKLATLFPNIMLYPDWTHRYLYRSSLLRHVVMWPLSILLPNKAAQTLGLVKREHCDGLIDISGYAYGDGFPTARTKQMLSIIRGYRRRKKPVIVLPQMFGPFNNSNTASAFVECMKLVDQVYARDQISFECAQNLLGHDVNLELAPDITIFSANGPVLGVEGSKRYGCIVPNERMLDQGLSLIHI